MQLQELYTTFLPKKANGDVRQVQAPSQMYLSSNIQKLKLMKMEKDRKKSFNSHLQNMQKDAQGNYDVPLNQFNIKKDDIKRSKSFQQSPIKLADHNENSMQARNQSIPFEQYINMKIQIQKKQQEEIKPSQNIFHNSFLQKINAKENNIQQSSYHEPIQQPQQSDRIYAYKQSNLSSKNMYQQSIVVLDYSKQEDSDRSQQNVQNFSKIMENDIVIQNQKSKQQDQEHYLGRQSIDYQKELEQYKLLQKKCKNQRDNSPMNVYFQQYSKSQQSHYDRYFPHYQIKIQIPSENNPEQKLGEVMGGKMKSYIPSELKSLEPDLRLQISSREKKDALLTQKFTVNSKIMQNSNLASHYNNQEIYEDPSNYPGINRAEDIILYQNRGKSSISQRPHKMINIQQPISSKVIKPPLSIQAYQNKDNIVVQNLLETTVNGEKQTYIIPLQQNYSICLNEIDRIKARRKLLFSKRGVSSNGDLQPFSKEDSKLQFINKIEQSRQTPKNQYDNFFKSGNQIKYIDSQPKQKQQEFQNNIQNNSNFSISQLQQNFQNIPSFENNDSQIVTNQNTYKQKHIKSQV